jgi:hypothetical protein
MADKFFFVNRVVQKLKFPNNSRLKQPHRLPAYAAAGRVQPRHLLAMDAPGKPGHDEGSCAAAPADNDPVPRFSAFLLK